MSALSVLILEDEPLARMRMRTLLSECGVYVSGESGDAIEAFEWLDKHQVDVVLVDIGLPGISGVSFARQLRERPGAPAVIFTTAYDAYAVEAFEMEAVDYLLKPVRLERLRKALDRVAQTREQHFTHFTVRNRDQVMWVSVEDARYLKAEAKYVTLVTADGQEYLLDDTLVKLEEELGDLVLRIHRSCLIMRHAIVSMERIGEDSGEWGVRLKDIDELLPVSRRQLPALRAARDERNR